MRIAAPWIALSMTANIALAAWLIAQRPTELPPTVARATPTASVSPEGRTTNSATDNPINLENAWARLNTDGGNDAALVSQLRSAGFPPSTIRAIVRAEIDHRFLARRRAIEAVGWQKPWWHVPLLYESPPSESRAAARALEREIQDAVGAALGVDWKLFTAADRARARREYGDFPLERIAQLKAIERDYGELRAQLDKDTKGVVLAEDRARFAALEQAERDDIARVLTPEELVELDRHASPTANDLRWKLRYFDATEAEYLTLYEIRRDFDARFGGPHNLSPEQRDARRATEPELQAAFAATLGAERYRTYQIATASTHDNVRSIVDQFELPLSTTRDVVSVQLEIAEQADELRRAANLSAAERARQLAVLADQATARVAAALGPKPFEEYRSTTGEWSEKLRTTAAP